MVTIDVLIEKKIDIEKLIMAFKASKIVDKVCRRLMIQVGKFEWSNDGDDDIDLATGPVVPFGGTRLRRPMTPPRVNEEINEDEFKQMERVDGRFRIVDDDSSNFSFKTAED